MARYKVKVTCYGFRNARYEEGDIIEADPKENPPPEYFELLKEGKVKPEPAAGPQGPEPQTMADIERENLLVEAKGCGIKDEDAKLLTNDELLAVLAKDISRQKIQAIIQKAKKRQVK